MIKFSFLKIKELQKELEELKKDAYIDHLTGVYNRRAFLSEAGKIFEEVKEEKKHNSQRKFLIKDFGLIFIDLDNFKKLNDKLGHDKGDEALKKTAGLLIHSLRRLDIVGRWGGEEFVLGLVGVTEQNLKDVAIRLRDEINTLEVKKGKIKAKLSASIGAVLQKEEKTLEDLINKADKLMYKAKNSGKNRVEF